MTDPYTESTRYPFTYAADKIRSVAGSNSNGSTKISRSEASAILRVIAEVLGDGDHTQIAKAIADHYRSEME